MFLSVLVSHLFLVNIWMRHFSSVITSFDKRKSHEITTICLPYVCHLDEVLVFCFRARWPLKVGDEYDTMISLHRSWKGVYMLK